MSSRLWLAVAFVLASGASPARAETSMIAVTLDQAKIVKLAPGTATLIVGNPMIADVTMLKNNNTMVITGKGFGQTNLIAIDASRIAHRGGANPGPAVENRAGLAERKLEDFIRLRSHLHADGSTRRRRQDFQERRRTDVDPQRLRRERLGNGRKVRRAAGRPARCVESAGQNPIRVSRYRPEAGLRGSKQDVQQWPTPALGRSRCHDKNAQTPAIPMPTCNGSTRP